MRLCGAPAGVLAARARAWADGDNALALNATRSLLLAALATVGRERSLRAVLDAPRKLLDVGVTVAGAASIFLSPLVMRDLGLEPNMDDDGDSVRTLWLSRVWELRELLNLRALRHVSAAGFALTDDEHSALEAIRAYPRWRLLVERILSVWRGKVARNRTALRTLRAIKFDLIRSSRTGKSRAHACQR